MSDLYRKAASTLRALQERKKTVKSLHGNGDEKSYLTLAIKTLTFQQVIDKLLSMSKVDVSLLDVDKYMASVMVYELLFSNKGKISGGGEVKRKLAPYFEALLAAKEELMIGKADSRELLSEEVQMAQDLPVYLRINTKVVSPSDALQYLQTTYPGITVTFDDVISNLMVIKPAVEGLGSDTWVLNGALVMQDKASCFPAQILANHYAGGDVIDACAAPGNKTSQLATFLHHQNERNASKAVAQSNDTKSTKKKGSGKVSASEAAQPSMPCQVFAFDKNPARAEMLQQRMRTLQVADLVTVAQRDFLTVCPPLLESVSTDSLVAPSATPDYSSVQNILLDPSCSGSGIVRNAMERILERQRSPQPDSATGHEEQQRLVKLQAFQQLVLQHALTAFPNVRTVVYSTCSVHCEENECVVDRVLTHPVVAHGWKLVAPRGFEQWTRRGLSATDPASEGKHNLTEAQAQCLLRCSPADGMNGFFVALFVRTAEMTVEERQELHKGQQHRRQQHALKDDRHHDAKGRQREDDVHKKRNRAEMTAGADEQPDGVQKGSDGQVGQKRSKKSSNVTAGAAGAAGATSIEDVQQRPVAAVVQRKKFEKPNASTSFFGKQFISNRQQKKRR